MDSSDEEMTTSWDVETYKTDYESDDHWNLRKAFMERNKDKFDEDELVCLAAVFTNMEFLGCRYPPETMRLVAEMSKCVPELDTYRSSRRSKLKRTFISASDAVEAKRNKVTVGHKRKQSSSSDEDVSEGKSDQKPSILLTPSQAKDAKYKLLKNVIFFDVGNDDFNGSINKTLSMMKKSSPVDLKYDADTTTYRYIYQGQIIGEGSGTSKKIAKKLADDNLLSTFRSYCYTIKSKLKFFTTENVITKLDQNSTLAESKVTKLQSDNVGFKMLKLLGWSGGSLGSGKTEGIIDPVNLEIKIGRLGLGSEAGATFDLKYFKRLLENYKNNSVEYDLVFSTEFTKEERAKIHSLAQTMGLRTKSYGKDNKRHIVISSNISPEILKQKLLQGDPILKEKYEIIPPSLK